MSNIGGISSAARNHISEIAQARVNNSSLAGIRKVDNNFTRQLSSVDGKKTPASEFKRTPSQTHLAREHYKAASTADLPANVLNAKFSADAEPVKALLSMIAKDIAPQDKKTFENVCEKLIKANGNPLKEKQVEAQFVLLMTKYGQASLNKFIANFTEDCREAWKQNHTGYGDSVADEVIFNQSMLVCQEVLSSQINLITSPDIKWVNIAQFATYFETSCVSVSKTLINYEPQSNKAPEQEAPRTPANADVPDSPQAPNAGPQGPAMVPGHGPININVQGATAYGGTATATAGTPVEKAPSNVFDFGIALTKNAPQSELHANLLKDFMARVLPNLERVSNSDSDGNATTVKKHAAPQTTITEELSFIQTENNGLQGDGVQGAEDSGVPISTDLLDELLTPPQLADGKQAGEGVEEATTGNGDLDLQDNSDTESLYDASRGVADALSDLVSELGTPVSTPTLEQAEPFFAQGGVEGGVTLQDQANGGADTTVGQQEGSSVDTLQDAPTLNNTRPEFATNAPSIKPQTPDLQANKTADEAVEQPAVQSKTMPSSTATPEKAEITTPKKGKGRVQQSIMDWENRAAGQRMENERLAGQRGSGMDMATARRNSTGGNINYAKDSFQPLKGAKTAINSYDSQSVYTTSRTIDPFSRVNAPTRNFIRQFSQGGEE